LKDVPHAIEDRVIEHTSGTCNYSCGIATIEIDGSSSTITGCTIGSSTAQYGLYFHDNSSSPTIENNDISGYMTSDGYGIYIFQGNPTVTGNTITGNNRGISIVGGTSGIYQSNTIKSNTIYGLYYSGASIIDATNCDWGDLSGPLDDSDDRTTGGWYNPNGLGDKVSDHVNYTPWKGWSVEIKGDVNGDTVVDLADAIAVLYILSRVQIQFAVNPGADVDGDGKITLAETAYVMQVAAGVRQVGAAP
jgi:parallel beta-helix repeat protein